MKLSATIIACCLVLSFLSGCQEAGSSVEVIISGPGEFPEEMVGTWRAEENEWELVFEADGRISQAMHGIGGALVKPEHVSKVDNEEEKVHSVYEAGKWRVHYIADERELRVEIVLDHVYLEWGAVILDGKVRDEFIGKISEDGKVWETEWFSFAEYNVPGEDDTVLAPKPEEVLMGVVTFKKVEEEK